MLIVIHNNNNNSNNSAANAWWIFAVPGIVHVSSLTLLSQPNEIRCGYSLSLPMKYREVIVCAESHSEPMSVARSETQAVWTQGPFSYPNAMPPPVVKPTRVSIYKDIPLFFACLI